MTGPNQVGHLEDEDVQQLEGLSGRWCHDCRLEIREADVHVERDLVAEHLQPRTPEHAHPHPMASAPEASLSGAQPPWDLVGYGEMRLGAPKRVSRPRQCEGMRGRAPRVPGTLSAQRFPTFDPDSRQKGPFLVKR